MRLNVIFFSFLFAAGGSVDLHKKLRYFETLESVDLKVVSRRKRSADDGYSESKQISFRALGRNFNLVLYPGSPVLSPNFKAKTVDAEGRTRTFHVNPNNFYTGHLAEDASVTVDAHFEEGVLSSSIRFPNDTYVVEPAWRHRLPSENYTMISYRGSDVNWEDIFPIDPDTGKRTKMKDGIRLDAMEPSDRNSGHYVNSTVPTYYHSRHKRAVRRNTCPLIVVADYLFFKDMGQSKRETTASFLIAAIQNVNQHYKRTTWDAANGYVNMGFQIDEMLIHTQFSNNSADHYNADVTWGYNEKLYAFSEWKHVNRFCLAHLFTSYAFPDNVLGLAFIAPESAAAAGGICSVPSRIGRKSVYPRTGWSSAKNTRNEQVLSLQFELVTTHGHNWGAEHDPDTSECGPSSRDNGKYVMWPYAVPGFEENNKFFSPCSKRYIAPVLRSKSAFCFRELVQKVDPTNQTDSGSEEDFQGLCGNGMIEKGEQCDEGFLEEGEKYQCCTDKCKLKPGAICSDFNHACCYQCQVASSSVLCEERNNLTCKNESYCDGKHTSCPPSGMLPNKTQCIDMGQCYNGRCLNFCALLGIKQNKVLVPCLCTQNATAMCRRCCMELRPGRENGECLPTAEVVEAGRTCHVGTCDERGQCVKVEQQLAFRIFKFIKHLTADKLVEFMRDNIVGTIIVLSLLIWIPASWVVSCVDKRKLHREEDYLQRWASRENTILGMSREDLSNFRIRNSRFTRIPPGSSHGQGQGQGQNQGNGTYSRKSPPQLMAYLPTMGSVAKDFTEEEIDGYDPGQWNRKAGSGGNPHGGTENHVPPRAISGDRGMPEDFADGTDVSGQETQPYSVESMDCNDVKTVPYSGSEEEGCAVEPVDFIATPVSVSEEEGHTMESGDSIDLSATPGSVSEEEGRTMAEV